MILDRIKAQEAFAEYTRNYDVEDSKIQLKIVHTYRVADSCEIIAKSLGLRDEENDLAWLCGLLHDIGRFEQIRIYNTFVDKDSVDHGHLSVEVLFNDGHLNDFVDEISDREAQILRDAIWNHSNYRLPEDLDEETILYCDILRDADKIDIFRVNVDFSLEDIYNAETEEIYNSEVTPTVLEALKEHHAVAHALKRSTVDYIVGHISLAYELVYPYSLEMLKEQGYMDVLLNFKSNNPKTNEQFEWIREEVRNTLF